MGVRHYLSQTYLEGFSLSQKRIYCYDKEHKSFIKSYDITKEQLKHKKTLYGSIGKLWCKPDDFWTQEIEIRMGKIERNFPKALEWIKKKTIDNNTELYDEFIQFVSLQILRSQVSQQSFDSRISEDKFSMINFCEKNEFEEWVSLLEKYNPQNNRKEMLEYFLDWIEDKSWYVYPNLRNRLVQIYNIESAFFITGDFPCFHLDRIERPDIFFPITQSIMLVFWEKLDGWSIIFPSSSMWSKQAILDMNKKLFEASERYVFCSNYELISSMI